MTNNPIFPKSRAGVGLTAATGEHRIFVSCRFALNLVWFRDRAEGVVTMSTAALECPTIRTAQTKTRDLSREVAEQKRKVACNGFDGVLRKSIDLVEAWKAVGETLAAASAKGRINDYRAIGDEIFPYVAASGWILEIVGGLVEANPLGCDLPSQNDFKIASWEMNRMTHYFEGWPRTRSETVAKIREEIARGEFRELGEILCEEVQDSRK